MDRTAVFRALSSMRWTDMLRTYGNSHSSYIGSFVSWWLALSSDHAVLDPGPSYALPIKKDTGGKRGQCDAVFVADDSPVGVLEVEGLRPYHVIEKVGHHFKSPREGFARLTFGIICLYSTRPKGRGLKKISHPLYRRNCWRRPSSFPKNSRTRV